MKKAVPVDMVPLHVMEDTINDLRGLVKKIEKYYEGIIDNQIKTINLLEEENKILRKASEELKGGGDEE